MRNVVVAHKEHSEPSERLPLKTGQSLQAERRAHVCPARALGTAPLRLFIE